MQFADAWLLWLMLPLFGLWVAAWIGLQIMGRRQRLTLNAALHFPSLATLRRLHPSWTVRWRRLVHGLRPLAVALLVLAMARPQTGRSLAKVVTEGVDIVVVVDTSGTMRALDLDSDRPISQRRTRLEVAKEVVDRFIQRRENDQIGLVVFGDEAFTQCPLTLDHGILATFLEQLQIGMAGDRTAIGSALGTAAKRLQHSRAKSKVAVLLTDGRNNAGTLSPKKAAAVAKGLGIKVYTVGVGTRGQAPFLQDTVFGQQVVYDDVAIDEQTLQEVAQLTGGAYFRAEDASGLQDVYDRIDKLERTELQMGSYMEYNERFAWFVLPALTLILLELLLLGTRLRKIP